MLAYQILHTIQGNSSSETDPPPKTRVVTNGRFEYVSHANFFNEKLSIAHKKIKFRRVDATFLRNILSKHASQSSETWKNTNDALVNHLVSYINRRTLSCLEIPFSLAISLAVFPSSFLRVKSAPLWIKSRATFSCPVKGKYSLAFVRFSQIIATYDVTYDYEITGCRCCA